ncbi:metal-dependent hydrolase [Methanomicrobiaceae archaeon CYW5]|uniref:metal-dependent hydrolase n=1 Tax=Methanovulcanius yangii TaxID=1789227 RepID=UPI0029CA2B7F|nr:metal-dependent hydrolase [Methanovulcanius yangii]MBT8507444.1 metal-dependent hydrolase [Methanovulcanius yangii]
MKLTWLGHACFLLEGTKTIIIDPFAPEGGIPDDVDMVALTHGHDDHVGETIRLGRKTVAINEIGKYLATHGLETECMNLGGTIEVDGVRFTMTPALHSGWMEMAGQGFYGGGAAGFVISMDGISVYHAGDTALFSDMKLIGELYHPDVACLPIGGRFTMGPAEAMMAAEFVGAPIVIPMHYNTFEAIRQDPHAYKKAVERTTDISVQVLSPGESMEIK